MNETADNALVICHALSGSSDVDDWWGELLGTDRAFDPSRYLIICINFLGSPYGSCSPVTIDKSTGKPYGPSFPLVTFKDDVGIQRLILDSLNVKRLAAVVGGSMGNVGIRIPGNLQQYRIRTESSRIGYCSQNFSMVHILE